MDLKVLDITRRQLERHFSSTLTRSYNSFWRDCRLLSNWLKLHPLLQPAIRVLYPTVEIYQAQMIEIADQFAKQQRSVSDADALQIMSFEEQAALAWAALDLVSQSEGEPHTGKFQAICRIMAYQSPRDSGAVVGIFQNFVLPALKDYLNDYLDGRDVTLYLIDKYKKKCEWFYRHRLREIACSKLEGRREGERSLTVHLYDFLHDQGLDFDIEPYAPDGLVDALADHWAIDAKYIAPTSHPSEITGKIASGFRQVADYCDRHVRAAGYLVVFRNRNITLQIDLEQQHGARFLRLGGKIIHYCEIDITKYEDSASHRGPAQIHVVSREDLLRAVPSDTSP